jgi:hypothetical protein
MDIELEKRINDAMASLQQMAVDDFDYQNLDPVAKMMLVALVAEAQKIQDYIDGTTERIVERYCADFIPRQKAEATPAVCLLKPELKPMRDAATINVGAGTSFAFKMEGLKQAINYIPIFKTALLPHKGLFLLTSRAMRNGERQFDIYFGKPNHLWVGIQTETELDNLQGLSLFIRGTQGVVPEHICTIDDKELEFASMRELENIEMAEPFDAQQASGQLFSFVESWKENLLNIDNAALLYITDEIEDRDMFKPRAYPRSFQQWLENEVLDCFDPETVWLRLEFPEGYTVPNDCEVVLNALPVTNIDINSLMLTQAQPLQKLQKLENSFFLRILETSTASNRQGFGMMGDEIIVRDFEAACYDNGALYRDVRNLYNHFIDDYYAFVEYNGIKDGETLKQLRETINKIGKSVGAQNPKYSFDSGTYVMKNMNQSQLSTSTKVTYITTQGRIGNAPRAGEMMDNRRLPGVEQKVEVLVSGMGGSDKATPDERYEQLRYFSLTNDRLYTRMDVDAFLRKEIISEFGKEEFRRIFIKTSIGGAGTKSGLCRGLYVDIEFKDRKNYQHAESIGYDNLIRQKIINKSCIALPIVVTLKNLEDE